MGYRIEYDALGGKYEVRNRDKGRLPLLPAALGLLLLGVAVFWPQGGQALRGMLIPGEDTLTIQAFQNMTDVLRGGGSLGDAVYTLCHAVIHGA